MTHKHVSQAWRAWLETQTEAQLQTSLGERERLVMTQESGSDEHAHTLREIEMIRDEYKRREEAERVKNQFFPRITLRKLTDASLLGQLLHTHAREVISMSQNVMQYKRLSEAGFPIGVQFVDPMTGETSNDIDQILHDLGERAIYAAELLAAVSEEMLRLRDEEGVNLSDTEKEAFGAIVQLVEEVRKDES